MFAEKSPQSAENIPKLVAKKVKFVRKKFLRKFGKSKNTKLHKAIFKASSCAKVME